MAINYLQCFAFTAFESLNPSSPLHVAVFHLTLGAVLVLMYLYWTRLDMFVTLEILAGLAVILFLSGNRLLASIAAARKGK